MIPYRMNMVISPRDAFYSPKKIVALDDAIGEIAGENIMAYPPGIPVVSLGEKITRDVVDYIKILKQEDCHLQGGLDPATNYIKVLGIENTIKPSYIKEKALPIKGTAL